MERSAIEQIVRAVVARMESESAQAVAKNPDFAAFSQSTQANVQAERTPGTELNAGVIPVETSARHVHLCKEDLKRLFGTEVLPCKKAISQPLQYLSEYRVRLIGPKGILENVAVLGPIRGATQVEISATDTRILGINAPVRLSGDLADAAMVGIQAGDNIVQKPCSIIAKRHVHMTPEDAVAFQVSHGQEVSLLVEGARPLTLHSVVVRVSKDSALALHIDTDESNAIGAWGNTVCRLENCTAFAQNKRIATAVPIKPVNEQTTLEARLVSEQDALSLHKAGAKALFLKRGQIITPLAVDTLKARGITLIREGQG